MSDESPAIHAAKVASIRVSNARSAREITEADARACAVGFIELYQQTRAFRPEGAES